MEVEIKKMENTAMLKDWFERVDSEKTGTITAPQLKVLLLLLLLQSPFCLFQFPKIPLSSLSFALKKKTTTFDLFSQFDQSALSVGNLEFSLSVVQQMIRSLYSIRILYVFLHICIHIHIYCIN